MGQEGATALDSFLPIRISSLTGILELIITNRMQFRTTSHHPPTQKVDSEKFPITATKLMLVGFGPVLISTVARIGVPGIAWNVAEYVVNAFPNTRGTLPEQLSDAMQKLMVPSRAVPISTVAVNVTNVFEAHARPANC
jgi:hypothetical protein